MIAATTKKQVAQVATASLQTACYVRDSQLHCGLLKLNFPDFRHEDYVKLTKLIESGEAAPSEINRQKDIFNEMKEYCYNDSDCRRMQVLKHFGEKFNPKNCHNLCDVCALDEPMIEEDVSTIALQILQLTEDLTSNGSGNVTKVMVTNVYRGSQIRDVKNKGYDTRPLFGAGKGIQNDKLARVLDHLLRRDALCMISVASGSWSNTYLQVRTPLL